MFVSRLQELQIDYVEFAVECVKSNTQAAAIPERFNYQHFSIWK